MPKSVLLTKKVQKYRGQYVAVARDKIIASGHDAVEAFRLAQKILGRKKVDGVYYVPQREDLLHALWIFPTGR